MQYMLLIYTNEGPLSNRTPEDFQKGMDGHRALMEETSRRGILVSANPLRPSVTAKTVRTESSGRQSITDGPFTETKEQLAGYYLLECKDIDEALAYAARIPTQCAGGGVGAVEVRPLLPFAEIQQYFENLCAQQPA
ncbi:MAG TPA: YciI family protein [Terriglobales bacterium]|nr:YciI family protein [Terriglobales bacterium]